VPARSLLRTLIALSLVIFLPSAEARADWLITPFMGGAFGTQTSFLILETDAKSSTQLIFGASAALLSRGVFGLEADWAYAPRFFERDNRAGNITGSSVNTLSGSAIFAVPLSVTRESLRPYAIAGMGLMHASADDAINFSDIHENVAAYNVGGGAIGLISPRTGFRFEIRRFRSIENTPSELTAETSARLAFWRATVGVVIRLAH
jgi:hypothetical protein